MSQILQKLYFFVKLSSSILLLLIVLVLIFVFSKSYFDQEAFIYEDSQKNIEQLYNQININNNSVKKLIKKIEKVESDLKSINDKIILNNNTDIENQIENLSEELDVVLQNQKENTNLNKSQILNNKKLIIDQYIKNISINIEYGLEFQNLIEDLTTLINKESILKHINELAILSNGDVLGYNELKKDFEGINNIFLKKYLVERSNKSVLIKFILKFFTLKSDRIFQNNDPVLKILSITNEYLHKKDIGNAVITISKITYSSDLFIEWINNASKYDKANKLILLIIEDL